MSARLSGASSSLAWESAFSLSALAGGCPTPLWSAVVVRLGVADRRACWDGRLDTVNALLTTIFGGPLAIAGGLAGIARNSRRERTRCVAESGVRWNA
jgi:hypothetical protein